MRDEPNVKFLWFKDMKLNQRGVIEELSQFLDHPVTATTIDVLENHLKFDNMRNNPKVNPTAGLNLKSDFMRKGEVSLINLILDTSIIHRWATGRTSFLMKSPSNGQTGSK